MPNGVLDQVVSDHGDQGGDHHQDQVVPVGEAGLADLLGGDDQDRPVPQVEGVGTLPQPLGGADPEERSAPHRGMATPPAMIRAAPTTGIATSEPG